MARKTGSHSEITGPKVRAAALKLFASQGYAAVSMRQIAAEVGVQAGALYLYTPDKQSLLYDLMHSHMDELLEAWRRTEKPSYPAALLERFVQFHIKFHVTRRDAVFISYMELRNLTPENFTELERLRRRYEDGLESILMAGQSAGEFRFEDSRLTTLALIAMLTGVTNWYKPGGRLTPGQVADIYTDMTLNSVACTRADLARAAAD
ncbi:MAG: TetR/AcrR family transcriptional regulator [Pseudomonadota bacterium]